MERIIHQIWVGPFRMPAREARFVDQVRRLHPEYQHHFWTSDNLPRLPDAVSRTYHMFGARGDYAFQADVLRVFLVAEYGGVYLDVDLECRAGLALLNLERRAGFFCRHGDDDFTIPNTAFGAAKDNPILRHLCADISPEQIWYGPSWMGDTVKRFYGAPRVFPHATLHTMLAADGVDYVPWSTFNETHFHHHSLYSWSPENRAKFARGEMP